MIYDSHYHLDLLEDMPSYIESIKDSELGILAVGTTPKAYEQEKQYCKNMKNVFVALGMHPQLVGSKFEDFDLFKKLCRDTRFIGEIGLDFSNEYIKTKDRQIEVFRKIIQLSENQDKKVLSIHSLKASDVVIRIIEEEKICNHNVYILHWFTGTPVQAKKALELGCFFSINPKMLKTKSGIEIIKIIPNKRILLESDAPFAMKAQPVAKFEDNLRILINSISEIKGIDFESQLNSNERMIFERE